MKTTKLIKCLKLWELAYPLQTAKIVIYSDGSCRLQIGINHDPEYPFDDLEEFYKYTFNRWPIELDTKS